MPQILLIDDDESLRKTLRITLQRLGHVVAEARDGDEAIRLHEKTAFDVVLTDLIMPNKEGIETIITLRRQRPDVKIIAMSGGGRLNAKDILAVAKAMGAHQVLAKPFSHEALVAALAAVTS